MLFDSPVDDLALADIEALIDRRVEEGKDIEYTAELDLEAHSYKHKQKLVGEVVSFANDDGGYFVIGVEEAEGVPQRAEGFTVEDPDAVKEQWGSIIRSNTDPQLPPDMFDIGAIPVDDGNYIVVVEVEQSWRAPHRETLNNIFYARSPSGRVELNVEEVRRRILGSDTEEIGEELRSIRDARISRIREREGIAATLEPGPMAVVHVLPVAVTRETEHIPASDLPVPRPLGEKLNGDDMTAESRYAWSQGGDEWYAYGLIQNSGLYEAVGNGMFSMWEDEQMIKSDVTSTSLGLDASIIVAVKRGLSALDELGFSAPVFVFVSILDAAEYKLDDTKGIPTRLLFGQRVIGTDVFTTPSVELSLDTDSVAAELEPLISSIYHQMGWEDGSPNYADGEWTGGNVTVDREQLL